MAEAFRFGSVLSPITTHAWNKSRTQIAFSPNNNEVHIYEKKKHEEPAMVDVLGLHDLRIMGIDWAPQTDRIVTCSADRNAFVWAKDKNGKWKHTLVHLRINRAATCVKWSPSEKKFAVGSGAKSISVCYFVAENDWWLSKHIKKPIESTVTCLDWHPNDAILVAGSSDFKVRVFSAFIKAVDTEDGKLAPERTAWGDHASLGQLLYEIANSELGGGWIHDISFSADGNKICWVAHDSSVNVVDSTKNKQLMKLRTNHLPFINCEWIGESSVVVAGHGCVPLVYTISNGELRFLGKLDVTQKREASGLSAMKKFQSLDRQARIETDDLHLNSIHQSAITDLRIYEGTKSKGCKLSTASLDGQIVVWDLFLLEKNFNNKNNFH